MLGLCENLGGGVGANQPSLKPYFVKKVNKIRASAVMIAVKYLLLFSLLLIVF